MRSGAGELEENVRVIPGGRAGVVLNSNPKGDRVRSEGWNLDRRLTRRQLQDRVGNVASCIQKLGDRALTERCSDAKGEKRVFGSRHLATTRRLEEEEGGDG